MTTTIKVNASCSDDKEVSISITDNETEVEHAVIQSGDEYVNHVYDGREIHVKEVEKVAADSVETSEESGADNAD